MKVLTKNTDYAIRALLTLAAADEQYISVKHISQAQHIPYQYLRRLTQTLVQHNLVESREGAAGGIKIIKNPKDITLTDLIEIFQGPIELSDCMFRKQLCQNRGTCVLRPEIKRIEKIVNEEFRKLTIHKLLTKLKADK